MLPLVAWLAILAPTTSAVAEDGRSPTAAGQVDDGYDAAAANADVQTLLQDTSRAYLQARARLEAHPRQAAAALIARLDASPPPPGAERKRMLDVLAQLRDAAHVPRFAAELRNAVVTAEGEERKFAAAQLWRPLLRDQGAPATSALSRLVGDRDLPIDVRAALLDDLVALTPPEALPELLVLVGRGNDELRKQLARSLRRRSLADDHDRTTLLVAIDTELERADPRRFAALLQLRATVDDTEDPAFVARLLELSADSARPFTVRVAALRGLAGAGDQPAAREGLRQIAAASLAAPEAGTQRGEILAWLALRALPRPDAAALAERHGLHDSKAPRLATVAWSVRSLPRDRPWWHEGLADPWPEVRAVVLSRIAAPCDRRAIGTVRARIGAAERGADPDAAVQRAAIDALSRCGDDRSFVALRSLLDDADVTTELSAEAARELARNYGGRGADAVARKLAARPERVYAQRLAQALRHAGDPTDYVREVLCATAAEGGEIGSTASASATELFGATACE